jgi:hypothetical protein
MKKQQGLLLVGLQKSVWSKSNETRKIKKIKIWGLYWRHMERSNIVEKNSEN